MDDIQIIELYNERSETAISETANKYGKYCYYIAYHILYDEQDSEECVNDTYLRAWESIPPQYPNKMSAFLGKITRNLALNRYRYMSSIQEIANDYEISEGKVKMTLLRTRNKLKQILEKEGIVL